MHAERPLVSVSIQLVLASVHQARISQDAWLECVLISGFTMSLPTVCIQQLWIGCGTGTGSCMVRFHAVHGSRIRLKCKIGLL